MKISSKKSNSNMFATLSILAVGAYYTTNPELMGLADNPSATGNLEEQAKPDPTKKKSLIDSVSGSLFASNQNITFEQWIRTPEAIESYEKWRKSPTGIAALSKNYQGTVDFQKGLEKWASSTKRDIKTFRKEALKKNQFKNLFNTWKTTNEAVETLKDKFIADDSFTTKSNDWIAKADASADLKKYMDSKDSANDYKTWIQDDANLKSLESKWKTSDDYTQKRNAWLAIHNAKDSKNAWLSSPKAVPFIEAWKKSASYRDDLISNWKTTTNYAAARDRWIGANSIKRSIEEYKQDESLWTQAFTNYKNSDAGNKEIENELIKKNEYITAKNSWSNTGKNLWFNNQKSNSAYNTWRVTSDGRNALKPIWEATNNYQGAKNSWIDNNYNPKSKDDWINTEDVSAQYNAWKATTAGKNALITTWKTTSNFNNAKQTWINLQTRTLNKNVWKATANSLNAYNTWKAIAANDAILKANWKTTQDYTSSKATWSTKTYDHLDTNSWADTNYVNSYYNAWRTTNAARNLLKTPWEASADFTSSKNTWASTNFDNSQHTKAIWSQDQDFTSKYNTWESSNEDVLKNSWKATNDYTTSRDSWINTWAATNDKDAWSAKTASLNAYNTWKAISANEASLKTNWKSTQDYTNSKSDWVTKTYAHLNTNSWADTNDANAYYNTWRTTSAARNLLKTPWEASANFTSSKNTWASTNFDNSQHTKAIWSQDQDFTSKYNAWESNNEDVLKNSWKATNDYTSSRDTWINTWAATNDKDAWSAKTASLNSYNTWKAISANETSLKTNWESKQDYTNAKNTWAQSSYTTISKDDWLNQDKSNSAYETWRQTPEAEELAKGVWPTTYNYHIARTNWSNPHFDYSSHRKPTWSLTQDSLDKYNIYKGKTSGQNALKAHYRGQSEYNTKYLQWLNAQNFTKSDWASSNDSLTNYQSWKATDGKDTLLENQWKTQSDYTTKLAKWVSEKGKSKWIDTNASSNTYNAKKNTSEFTTPFISHWKTQDEYNTTKIKWIESSGLDAWKAHADSTTSYNSYKSSVEGDKALKKFWKDSSTYKATTQNYVNNNPYAVDKNSWVNSADSDAYYNDWIVSKTGQPIMIAEWEKTPEFAARKAEWLANYTPPYTKDEWINDFQATKITDSVSWYKKSEWEKKYNKYIRTYSNELQNHFNSIPLYNQRRYQWIQNKYIKPFKSQWNDLSASTTAYNAWKNTPEGEKVLKDAYKASESYKSDINKWDPGSGNSKRVFNDWKQLNVANDKYLEWKDTSDGQTALKTHWETTNDFTTKKQDWTNQGSVKRSIDSWFSSSDANSSYDTWRQSSAGQNLLKPVWEETKSGSTSFARAVNNWFNANNPTLDTKEKWLNSQAPVDADFETWFAKQNIEDLREQWINTQAFEDIAKTDTSKKDFLSDPNQIYNAIETAIDNVLYNKTIPRDGQHTKKYRVTRIFDNGSKNIDSLAYYMWKEGWNIRTGGFETIFISFFFGISQLKSDKYSSDIWKISEDLASGHSISISHALYKKAFKELLSEANHSWRKEIMPWFVYFHENFYKSEISWQEHRNKDAIPQQQKRYREYLHKLYKTNTAQDEYENSLKAWAKTKWADDNYMAYKTAEFKKDNAKYNEALNAWSSNKRYGKDTYLKTASALNEYNNWNDANPITTTDDNYKTNYQYQIDYENYIKSVDGNGNSMGLNYYLTQNQARTDYNAWVDPTLQTNYEASSEFQSNYETYRDGEKGKEVYLSNAQSTTDYQNWNDLAYAQEEYKKSFQHRMDLTKYFQFNDQGIIDGKNLYRNNSVSTTDYNDWVAYDKTVYDITKTHYKTHFDAWRQDKANRISFYNNNGQSTHDYNDFVYKQDPNYATLSNNDFTSFINGVPANETKSRGLTYYLNSEQAKSDYNTWIAANAESAYAASNKFVEDYKWYRDRIEIDSTKSIGYNFYMKSALANNDYATWIAANKETHYKASDDYQKDFDSYWDGVETGETLTRGHNFYLGHSDSDAAFNSWLTSSKTSAYEQTPTFNTNYQNYINQIESGQTLSRGHKFYLTQNQSITDFTDWVNEKVDVEFKKATTAYNNGFNAWKNIWLPVKANGLSLYKNHASSTTDYNNWIESDKNTKYKASNAYQNDFETYRDTIETGETLSNGHKFYLTQGDSNTAYNSWKTTTGQNEYLASSDFQSDFESYRDTTESGETLSNGEKVYFNHSDATTAYNNWKSQKIDAAYKADITNYNSDLDAWSATKANGLSIYKTQAQASSDFNAWKVAEGNAKYDTHADFQSDFEAYRDTIESGETLSNGHKFYLTQGDSDSDYISWKTTTGQNEYLASSDFQSDFESHRDTTQSGETLSNGEKVYFAHSDATSAYNNWKSQKIDAAYKADTNNYNSDLDAWSATKANGISIYKTQAQANSDFNVWKVAQGNANYDNDPDFQSDFEAYRDTIATGQTLSNGHKFYLTQGDSDTDFTTWKNTKGSNDYLNSQAFDNDFNSWESFSTGKSTYKASAKSNSDYQAWVYQKGETPYKNSNQYNSDLDTWSTTKANGLNTFKTSQAAQNAWDVILDSEFAKTTQHTNKLNELKATYSKDIYKASTQFITDYKAWDDPKKKSEAKYLADSDNKFSTDLNTYYDTDQKKVNAYSNSRQSDIDYNLYIGDTRSEMHYLVSAQKALDLKTWGSDFDNGKEVFKTSAFVKTQTTRTAETYKKSNQFIADAKIFLSNSGEQYFDLYMTGSRLQAFYENWKDPVGVERDPEAFMATNDFIERINSWSANIINGMEAFKSSTLAQSLFLRYKNK